MKRQLLRPVAVAASIVLLSWAAFIPLSSSTGAEGEQTSAERRTRNAEQDVLSSEFNTPSSPDKPFGLEKRIPLTTSRVVGAPEPPPPYRLTRAFPRLKFHQPLYIENEPGSNRLLVVQQDGKILRFPNDPDVGETELFLDLGRQTYGLTFHPRFAENGYMYVVSNGTRDPNNMDANSPEDPKQDRVSRFTVDRKEPYKCDPATELIIIEWESAGHDGGDLVFGHDGMLYIPAGDGTTDSDTNDTGQDITNLNATMIRIDVDHPDADWPYSVPADNPFLKIPGARPEIWAFGFRNPWRCTVDAKTGDLWVGNIGQDLWELVHVVKRGDNYGWAAFEGSHPFHEKRKVGPAPVVKPTIEHPHSEARSITGGLVYYGPMFPELAGLYLYGDYSTGKIWAAKYENDRITYHREIADSTVQILGFGTDPQGEIYVVDYTGGLYRLERTPAEELAANPDFPRLLSETGLFQSVAGHVTQPGLVPYSVNAQLWSDGSHKERYIAIPGEEQIDYRPDRGWNFPDLSVLVKTFSLDMEAGNPRSRRRIETRLLTKQQGEWVGYSYLWNDDQTDAELVDAKGADRTYLIRDAAADGGRREQAWHYPSRAECMVCHSRAANYVLGMTTLQMNRDHDYGEATDNQLRTLEHIGLFRTKLPKPADKLERLVDPYDAAQPLDARARSYIHANCSICHVDAGGGNSRMLLEFKTDAAKTFIIDEKPQHQSFGIEDARIVAPGDPARSTLFHRISRRGQGQMPPLATALVDEQAVALFREWIARMKPAAADTTKPSE